MLWLFVDILILSTFQCGCEYYNMFLKLLKIYLYIKMNLQKKFKQKNLVYN